MKYECHAHMFLNGTDYEAARDAHKNSPDEEIVRHTLQQYKDAGVRYIRDGGDKYGVSLLAAKLAPEYGIEYASPAFAIYKKGNYGGFLGKSFEDMAGYRTLVKEAKDAGASFIKVMISGILDFSKYGKLTGFYLSCPELKEMTEIAHGEGLAVMAHANGSQCVKNAVMAGIDSIEHGYYIDDECIRLLAESDCFWVPTSVTSKNIIGCGRFPDDMLKKIHDNHMENIKKACRAGVKLAPGSDAGSHLVLHANGILQEYDDLTEYISEDELNKNAELLARRFKALF